MPRYSINYIQTFTSKAERTDRSYSWNNNAYDEVNALLNYGYAILEAEIRKGINAIVLDPSIGFLHEIAESKTPLVYDIQELFRWLVDLSVIELLEEKKLKKNDFIVTENYHIRLRENTAKLLIEKIKKISIERLIIIREVKVIHMKIFYLTIFSYWLVSLWIRIKKLNLIYR